MDRDYIGNLKAIAGVNYNSVSEQSLQSLQLKYNLTDAEVENILIYCRENRITIYDENEIVDKDEKVLSDKLTLRILEKAAKEMEMNRERVQPVEYINMRRVKPGLSRPKRLRDFLK